MDKDMIIFKMLKKDSKKSCTTLAINAKIAKRSMTGQMELSTSDALKWNLNQIIKLGFYPNIYICLYEFNADLSLNSKYVYIY